MRIGSLFSGYGGLDMGIQSVLGGDTAWFVEFDKAPSRILAHHWPDVPNYGDITTVDWSQVEPVDIITGGFPCQDVSHAGRRAGLIRDGEGRTRSGLWGEMLRAIVETKPRLVVAENVRGLLSARADSDMEQCPFCMGDSGCSPMRALGAVLGDLADIGFDAAWYGLRAADVGAAHGRFRVFIFAWPAADASSSRLWEHTRGAPAQEARANQGHQPAGDGAGEHVAHVPGQLTLLPTPAVNDMGAAYTPEQWDAWTARMQAAHGNGNGHGKSLAIEAQRLLPTPVSDNSRGLPSSGTDYASLPNAVALLPTPRTENNENRQSDGYGGKDGNFYGLVTGQTSWSDYGPAIARWETVIGRTAPAPTEPGKNAPRLSAAFVEWLMGLPAGHITDPAIGISRNDTLKVLGNGVVPAQCAAATRAFLTDYRSATKEAS